MITPTEHDLDILARTLYGEACGEYRHTGIASLIAIGNVIVNRLEQGRFGKTIADVCLAHSQFSCWNKDSPLYPVISGDGITGNMIFHICQDVARGVTILGWPDLTKGSDHYHADYCKPVWADPSKLKVALGRHLFYQLP